MKWTILRHCGRRSGGWRVIFTTDFEHQAHEEFFRLAHEIDQGTLQMIDPRGNVTAVEQVPPLIEVLNGPGRGGPQKWFWKVRSVFTGKAVK